MRTVRQIGRSDYVAAPAANRVSDAKEAAMRRPRAVCAIVLCSFLLMLIVSAVAAAHIVNYRDTVFASHQSELRNVALILAENTNRNFQNLDR